MDRPGAHVDGLKCVYEFNGAKKGWHYGFNSSRYSKEIHVYAIYVFQAIAGGKVTCIDILPSEKFNLISQRRAKERKKRALMLEMEIAEKKCKLEAINQSAGLATIAPHTTMVTTTEVHNRRTALSSQRNIINAPQDQHLAFLHKNANYSVIKTGAAPALVGIQLQPPTCRKLPSNASWPGPDLAEPRTMAPAQTLAGALRVLASTADLHASIRMSRSLPCQ